jgi:hypothetical protein
MNKKLGACPDCGEPIGERHRTGCALSAFAGWQALSCSHFDPNDARRQTWNGKWPGDDDCERLGVYALNRLFTDCVWDANAQRWKRRQWATALEIRPLRASAHRLGFCSVCGGRRGAPPPKQKASPALVEI